MELKRLRTETRLPVSFLCDYLGLHPHVYDRMEKEEVPLPKDVAKKADDLYAMAKDMKEKNTEEDLSL